MNNRTEPRENADDRIHIQVQHGAEHGLAHGIVLHADTNNVSAQGINANSDYELAEGIMLDVLVEIPGEKPYLLTAEVRWCNADNHQFRIGFQLLNNVNSDYLLWQQRFDGIG